LKFEAQGRVAFEDGAARFVVEPQAKGFEVQTKDLRVIDLGTEFGIDARDERRGEVHVIRGSVEVSSLAGRKESMRVEAGGAVALGVVGKIERTLFNPDRFVARLPAGIPALRFDFEPAGAATFEGAGAIARRDVARISSIGKQGAESVAGRGGGVLAFREGHYAISNWPGIGGTNPRTVAFWIRLADGDEVPPGAILGWGNFSDPEKMADFGLRTVSGKGQLRIVSGRRWLKGQQALADGRWHHVLVMLGQHRPGAWPEAKLFIDGEEDALIPGLTWQQPTAPLDTFSTQIHHDLSQPLTLGRFYAEGTQWLPGLRGELDELIIAEGVLTAGQVRAVYEGRLQDSGLDLGR
jgi:hypothetical protein